MRPWPEGQRKEDLFVNSRLNSRIIALSAAFAILGLDQLTKHWALLSLGAVGTTIKLAGPIDLTLVFNRSNAFGLIPDYGEFSRWALTALNLAIAAILLRFVLRQSTSIMNAFGFAFISAEHSEMPSIAFDWELLSTYSMRRNFDLSGFLMSLMFRSI